MIELTHNDVRIGIDLAFQRWQEELWCLKCKSEAEMVFYTQQESKVFY